MDVGVIVGASLAACSVIILACGLVVWYIARKRYKYSNTITQCTNHATSSILFVHLFILFRYKAKQTHTVLYASVNPEYLNSTDGKLNTPCISVLLPSINLDLKAVR